MSTLPLMSLVLAAADPTPCQRPYPGASGPSPQADPFLDSGYSARRFPGSAARLMAETARNAG